MIFMRVLFQFLWIISKEEIGTKPHLVLTHIANLKLFGLIYCTRTVYMYLTSREEQKKENTRYI